MSHLPRPHKLSASAVGMMAAQLWASLPVEDLADADGPSANMRVYGSLETYRERLIRRVARDAADLARAIEDELQGREDEAAVQGIEKTRNA